MPEFESRESFAPGDPGPRFPKRDRQLYASHLYVLGFSSGAVKVGMTSRLRERITKHRNSPIFRRHALNYIWTSDLHVNARDNELALIAHCREFGVPVEGSTETFHGVDIDELVAVARSLPFNEAVSEFEWAKADRERNREYAERTGIGLTMEDFMSPDFILVKRALYEQMRGESLSIMFGRKGEGHAIPIVRRSPFPTDLVHELAATAGLDIDEVLSMDFIDLLENLMVSKVRTEALRLRAHALQNGRCDLLAKVRDHREVFDLPDL